MCPLFLVFRCYFKFLLPYTVFCSPIGDFSVTTSPFLPVVLSSAQADTKLMIPGPTPLPDVVRVALGQPAIGHRSPEFKMVLEYVYPALQRVFKTKNSVLMYSASGSGAMDAAVSNTLNVGDKVVFGATVVLEDEEGNHVTYQIVGDAEADIDAGKISISSPIARAMIGKSEDDEIEVQAPAGDRVYFIESIKYI